MMLIHTRVVWQWRNGVLVELPEEGESYEYAGPVALAGSGSPVSREVHYRIRNDAGAIDAAPTWAANEDTAASISPGTNFRVRQCVENTGTAADTILGWSAAAGGTSRCGYGGASWTVLANVLNGVDASSSADAADVATQRLTSATGSFATATGGYDENESMSVNITNGNFCEVETGVVFTGGASTIGVGGGESWTFALQGLTNAAAVTTTVTTPDTNGTNFSHGAQLGGASQIVANSANISMTTSAAASSGNLVVVAVSCDNNGTTDGDFSEISGVTIGGVAATKAVEFTNGQGSAQAGMTVSIWYLQLTGDLASSSTITATFTNATTSGDANTIQAREYVVTAGYTVAVEATNGVATDAAASPNSTDATTSNIECLRIAAHALEEGVVNTATSATSMVALARASNSAWSLWWVAGFLGRSTGTTAADNSCFVESTVSTGTSKASLIGSIVSGDWASAYVAFRADSTTTNLMGQICT